MMHPGGGEIPQTPAHLAPLPPELPNAASLQRPPRRHIWLTPAAIVLGCGLIAGALVLALGGREIASPPPPPGTSSAGATAGDAATTTSSTCSAWHATADLLSTVPALPDGWGWDTPGIDVEIAERTAGLEAAMDFFEPQIADDPANVAAVARTFVSAKRAEIQGLEDGTLTQAQASAVSAAADALIEFCGMP